MIGTRRSAPAGIDHATASPLSEGARRSRHPHACTGRTGHAAALAIGSDYPAVRVSSRVSSRVPSWAIAWPVVHVVASLVRRMLDRIVITQGDIDGAERVGGP